MDYFQKAIGKLHFFIEISCLSHVSGRAILRICRTADAPAVTFSAASGRAQTNTGKFTLPI